MIDLLRPVLCLLHQERAESTIYATATKVKNCDERLDVEKRSPSLVSYLLMYLADIEFIEKREIPKINLL